MEHPTNFLLGKIINYKTNGFKSLGQLDAKHVDDISNIMKEFAEETAIDVIKRLNKGQQVNINGQVFKLVKVKK